MDPGEKDFVDRICEAHWRAWDEKNKGIISLHY